MAPTPHEYARGIRRGDKKLINQFYEQYSRFIYKKVYNLVGSSSYDANDVFQNVIIKIIRSKPKWKNEAAMKSWLSMICKHASVDFFRKESKFKNIDGPNNADEKTPADDSLVKLERALINLPDQERVIIEDIYFKKLSRQQIAEQHGISYKALESKIGRIKIKLKSKIEELNIDEQEG